METTPFGYPPRTSGEFSQCERELLMEAEEGLATASRFEEAPDTRKQDAIQAIIGHCFDAEEEVRHAGHPPDEFNARRLVGYLRRTLQSILEECKRLT